jgi:O-antigen/teichoic acid export membrane protein
MGMNRGVVRRVSAGFVATGSSFVIGTSATLLLLPLYLRAWSTVMYGEWMALSAMAYYLQNCDFGLTAATLNAATMSYARGDRAEFDRVRDTAWAISATVSTTAFLCVVLAAYSLPIHDWLRLKTLSPIDVRRMTILLAGSFLLTMPTAQLRNAFAASGRFHVYQWLWNIAAIQAACITAIQLLARQSPLWIAVGGLLSQLLAMLTAVVALRLSDRSLLPCISGVDRKTIPVLLKPSAFFGVATLSTSIQLQVPVLLISRGLGGTAVALFTSARTICNLLKQIPMMVQLPLARELSSLAGQKRKDELRHLHRAFMAVTLLIGVTILAAIYTQGPSLVGLWSHGHLQVDSTMFRILALSIFIEGNIYAWAATALAKNENGGVSKIQFSSAVLMSVLTAVLLPKVQLLATPIAMLLVILFLGAPLLLREVVSRNDLTWPWAWKNMVLPIAAGITVVLLVCTGLLSWVGTSDLLMAIMAGGICFTATAVFNFAFLVSGEERLAIRSLFRRILPA